MKSSAVLFLSSALFVLARDVSPVSAHSTRSASHALYKTAYDMSDPKAQKLLIPAKDCLIERFNKVDSASLNSVNQYLDAFLQCQNSTSLNKPGANPEHEYSLCTKKIPPKPDQAIEKLSEVITFCITEVRNRMKAGK